MENNKKKFNFKIITTILLLTVISFGVSIVSLILGQQIIFQNIFYFPIILSCFYYSWRGFYFSIAIAVGYFVTMAVFSQDLTVLGGAFIRLIIFILVSLVITYISIERGYIESESVHHKALFTSSRDAIMTLEPPTWKFTTGNPATLRMFGVKDEAEFSSTEPWKWSPEKQPDGRLSREKAKEMINIAMREGSNFFEWTHRRSNGENFPASVLLIKLEISGKEFLQATIRDLTEQKKAEEDLKFKNVILSTQQEASIDGILVVDENGKILNSNKRFADIWGIPQDIIKAASDESALRFVSDKLVNPEEFINKVKYLYENRDKASQDEISLKDGRVLERYSAPMIGEDLKYYGRVWYFRDITDRKKEEELKKSIETTDRLNKIMTNREIKMVELKKENEELKKKLEDCK